MEPEKSVRTRSRYSWVTYASALFSPRLDPVLNRGKRDKDAVVPPEVPTGGPIGKPVFHHQPDRCLLHPVGVMGVGQGQLQHVGVEIVSTGSTVMLRIGALQLAWSPRQRITQIIERPLGRSKSIRPVTTLGTTPSAIVAGPPHDPRRGKILDPLNTFGGITHIASRAIHDRTSKNSLSWRDRPL
jgi:hypothetical protein